MIGRFPEVMVNMYRDIYADAFRVVWYVVTGIAVIGLIASLRARNVSMDRGNNARQAFKQYRGFAEAL